MKGAVLSNILKKYKNFSHIRTTAKDSILLMSMIDPSDIIKITIARFNICEVKFIQTHKNYQALNPSEYIALKYRRKK